MDDDTADQWMAEVRAWAASHPQEDRIVDVSRESTYRNHLEPTAARPGAREGPSCDSTAEQGRTDLGKRLRAIRGRIVASGQPLLDWDGLEERLGRPGAVPGGGE